MKANPTLFYEATQRYEQQRLEYVLSILILILKFSLSFALHLSTIHPISHINPTDCFQINVSKYQHAVWKYEQWTKIRKQAVKNSNGKLPEGFAETEPPSPPPLVEDQEIHNLVIRLGAMSLDMQMLSDSPDNSETEEDSMEEDDIFY